MAQETAVDYFAQWVSYHKLNQNLTLERLDELITNAKQMEKEQIQEAWNDGNFLGRNGNILADYSDGNRYYKKEFENK